MLITGDKEVEADTVSVRSRSGGDIGSLPVSEFESLILKEIRTRALTSTLPDPETL